MARIERVLPPYEQVAQHLRDQIARKELAPGDLIPSERELADEWNISRATATKAVATLRSQGLVESITGVGTKVVVPQIITRSPRDRYQHVERRGRMHAEGEDVEILPPAVEHAPEEVYVALELEAGTEAIKRSRITRIEGTVVELSTSWFDHAIARDCEDLLDKAPIDGGTTAYIAERLGYHHMSVFDDITCELACDDPANDAFGIEGEAAILVTRTTVIDENHGPFEFGVCRHRPGHHATYTYDL